MSNTPENNGSTGRQNEKVHPPGDPSKSTKNSTTASSSVLVSLEEQIVTQIAGQGEEQTPNEEEKKEGVKKRPASEINGGQSDEPAKKVKGVAAEPVENSGEIALPSTTISRIGSAGPKARRRRPNSRRVPDVSCIWIELLFNRKNLC